MQTKFLLPVIATSDTVDVMDKRAQKNTGERNKSQSLKDAQLFAQIPYLFGRSDGKSQNIRTDNQLCNI